MAECGRQIFFGCNQKFSAVFHKPFGFPYHESVFVNICMYFILINITTQIRILTIYAEASTFRRQLSLKTQKPLTVLDICSHSIHLYFILIDNQQLISVLFDKTNLCRCTMSNTNPKLHYNFLYCNYHIFLNNVPPWILSLFLKKAHKKGASFKYFHFWNCYFS